MRAAAQEEGHGEEEVGLPAWVEAVVGVAGRRGDGALAGGRCGGAGCWEGVVGVDIVELGREWFGGKMMVLVWSRSGSGSGSGLLRFEVSREGAFLWVWVRRVMGILG